MIIGDMLLIFPVFQELGSVEGFELRPDLFGFVFVGILGFGPCGIDAASGFGGDGGRLEGKLAIGDNGWIRDWHHPQMIKALLVDSHRFKIFGGALSRVNVVKGLVGSGVTSGRGAALVFVTEIFPQSLDSIAYSESSRKSIDTVAGTAKGRKTGEKIIQSLFGSFTVFVVRL